MVWFIMGRYVPVGSRDDKRQRALVASDATWDLWDEVLRRERLLSTEHVTAGELLRRVLNGYQRVQVREADRAGVDLTKPPPATMKRDDEPPGEPEFRSVPRPQSF